MSRIFVALFLLPFLALGQSVKISDMPAATDPVGTELVPVVQGGVNRKMTVSQWQSLFPLLSGSYSNPSWITSLAWSKVASTPTTIAGYGITDFNTLGDARYPQLSATYNNPTWINQLAWSKITGTPTSLGGYGITDAVPSSRTLTINGTALNLSANRNWSVGDVLTSGSYSNPSWITSLAWSKISSTPTTIAGYGITDFNTLGDARYPQLSANYNNPTWLNQLAWSKITGTPTSLSAYGVTGAETLSSLRLNGTAGAGFLQWDWQSSNPEGTASRTTMWADATGRLNWRLGTGGSSFIRTFDATGITANRTYTLPDFSGTLFGQGANVLTAPASFSGNKVTFTPNATLAGLNVGSFGTSPSSLALGDIWFNDAAGNYQGRVSTGTRLFTVSAGIADTRVPYGLGTINELTSSASFTYNGTTLLVGGTTPTASTTLDIRGPGTDNTTTVGRFANSSNTQLMRLFSGGSLLLGGTTLTNNNTILDIQSTTRGVALPRMTDTQRNAITSPYSGLQIHSTTSNRPNWHNGTAWQEAASRSDLNGWLTGTLDNTTTTLNGATGDLVFDDFSSVTFSTIGSMTLGDVATNVSIPGAVQLGGAGGSASMTSTDAAISVTTGTNALAINDGRVSPKGIEYAADYSANYTSRSLVDRGYVLGAKTFTGRQTFATGNNGSLVVGTHTVDDSSPVNGLIMYNTTSNTFRFRQNGAWVGLGGGGGITEAEAIAIALIFG